MVHVLWSVNIPLESMLALSAFRGELCVVHNHTLQRNPNIPGFVSSMCLLKSIFASTSRLDCMGCSVSDEVDVLMSSGGMDEYQLVSDKHLY